MSESYTVVLNTQNSKNIIQKIDTNGDIIYWIDWKSILPTKYDSYECTMTFRTVLSTTANTVPARLEVNMSRTNTYGQNNLNSYYIDNLVALTIPTITRRYYFESNRFNQQKTTISYQSLDNYVRVKLLAPNSTTYNNFYDYILTINLDPIKN